VTPAIVTVDPTIEAKADVVPITADRTLPDGSLAFAYLGLIDGSIYGWDVAGVIPSASAKSVGKPIE
jgi:hypothetical protein